jgi:membrane protein DedA with SNARE-associated domain
MHLVNLFSSFVNIHPGLAYGALFLGVFWEGELTLIAAGILNHLGIFSLWPTLLTAASAAILKTVIGYKIGAFLGKSFPKSRLLKFFERKVLYFLPRFRERPFWSIFVSKFIYGVNNATLVFAGYARANFKEYCLAELLSSVVWLGGMFGLGYFFSRTAFSISHNLRNFLLIVALFIIAFMIVQKVINLIVEIVEEWD